VLLLLLLHLDQDFLQRLLLHLLPLIQLLHLDLPDYLVVVILAVNYQFQQYHIL
jgi:hypothetical protein